MGFSSPVFFSAATAPRMLLPLLLMSPPQAGSTTYSFCETRNGTICAGPPPGASGRGSPPLSFRGGGGCHVKKKTNRTVTCTPEFAGPGHWHKVTFKFQVKVRAHPRLRRKGARSWAQCAPEFNFRKTHLRGSQALHPSPASAPPSLLGAPVVRVGLKKAAKRHVFASCGSFLRFPFRACLWPFSLQ